MASRRASSCSRSDSETTRFLNSSFERRDWLSESTRAAFAAAVQPAYDAFADRYAPELIARIRAAQD